MITESLSYFIKSIKNDWAHVLNRLDLLFSIFACSQGWQLELTSLLDVLGHTVLVLPAKMHLPFTVVVVEEIPREEIDATARQVLLVRHPVLLAPLGVLDLSCLLIGRDEPGGRGAGAAEHPEGILVLPISEEVKTANIWLGRVSRLGMWYLVLVLLVVHTFHRLQSKCQNRIVDIRVLLLVVVGGADLLLVQLYDVPAAHVVQAVVLGQIIEPLAVMKVVVEEVDALFICVDVVPSRLVF